MKQERISYHIFMRAMVNIVPVIQLFRRPRWQVLCPEDNKI